MSLSDGCPACGTAPRPGAFTCDQCGLEVALFSPLAEALESPHRLDGSAAEAELLHGFVGGPGPLSAELAAPARFPSTIPVWAPVPAPGTRVTAIPRLPELTGGDPAVACRSQIQDLDTLLRRRSVLEPSPSLRGEEELSQLEDRRRSLFVRAAAVLTDELESSLGRFREIGSLVDIAGHEGHLLEARDALAMGDLRLADDLLRRSAAELDRWEAEWTEIRVLLVQTELLEETLRELGEDPGSSLSPIREARRLARIGNRAMAERLLARGALSLWLRLSPALEKRLRTLRENLDVSRLDPSVRGRIGSESAEIARALAHRNFGAAILAYRRLRDAAPPTESGPTLSSPSH